MKNILKLKLNKATIATLNDSEKSNIKGGCATYIDPISCMDASNPYVGLSCGMCASGDACSSEVGCGMQSVNHC